MATLTVNPLNIRVNLLESTRFDHTYLGKALRWALTIGKALVFLTFLIVMGTFAYRFSLDKKIESFAETMEAYLQGLNEYTEIEPKIFSMQRKLNNIAALTSDQLNLEQTLTTLESTLPPHITLQALSIENQSTILIEGTAVNEIVFATFLAALTQEPNINEVTVNHLQSGGAKNPIVNFSLSFSLKT